MHPINAKQDWTSEVRLREVEPHQIPIIRRTLNAGSVLSYVDPDGRPGEEDRYYVHKDLYKTLCIISR
jgi:hypothetical protein